MIVDQYKSGELHNKNTDSSIRTGFIVSPSPDRIDESIQNRDLKAVERLLRQLVQYLGGYGSEYDRKLAENGVLSRILGLAYETEEMDLIFIMLRLFDAICNKEPYEINIKDVFNTSVHQFISGKIENFPPNCIILSLRILSKICYYISGANQIIQSCFPFHLIFQTRYPYPEHFRHCIAFIGSLGRGEYDLGFFIMLYDFLERVISDSLEQKCYSMIGISIDSLFEFRSSDELIDHHIIDFIFDNIMKLLQIPKGEKVILFLTVILKRNKERASMLINSINITGISSLNDDCLRAIFNFYKECIWNNVVINSYESFLYELLGVIHNLFDEMTKHTKIVVYLLYEAISKNVEPEILVKLIDPSIIGMIYDGFGFDDIQLYQVLANTLLNIKRKQIMVNGNTTIYDNEKYIEVEETLNCFEKRF